MFAKGNKKKKKKIYVARACSLVPPLPWLVARSRLRILLITITSIIIIIIIITIAWVGHSSKAI